ncbi:MAG: alpha/beta fold hydrolase [Caulobacteraceae bacterium]
MPKLNRNGVELYYEVHGEGTPVLLTHGYSSSSHMWEGQVGPFSRHYKLITWDMRGHGHTDYPDDQKAYSEAETVADMAAILDAVGAKSAVIGGLSLGGYMSLAFHLAHPERTQALLIIDTGPGYKKDEPRAGWNATSIKRAERLEAEGLPKGGGAETPHRAASQCRRPGQGRAGHADPGRRAGDREPAEHQGPVAGGGGRRGRAVHRRLRLHGGQDPRREEGGDPERRARVPTSTSRPRSTTRCWDSWAA